MFRSVAGGAALALAMLTQVAAAGAGTISLTTTAADGPAAPEPPQVATRAAGTWGACGSWWSETSTRTESGSVCGVDGLVTDNGEPTQLAEPLIQVTRYVCLKGKRSGCTDENYSGTVRRSEMTVDPFLRRMGTFEAEHDAFAIGVLPGYVRQQIGQRLIQRADDAAALAVLHHELSVLREIAGHAATTALRQSSSAQRTAGSAAGGHRQADAHPTTAIRRPGRCRGSACRRRRGGCAAATPRPSWRGPRRRGRGSPCPAVGPRRCAPASRRP